MSDQTFIDPDADFVEITFDTAENMQRANKILIFSALIGEKSAIMRQSQMDADAIAEALKPLSDEGVAFTFSQSGITDEDMWPEDSDDDAEDEATFSGPGL